MTKDRINRKTVIIIRKNRLWLKGRDMLTREIEWTSSPYEAWKTKDEEQAAEVARRFGGIMVLFNPIINKKRVIGA